MKQMTRRSLILTAAAAGATFAVVGQSRAQVPQYGVAINLEQARKAVAAGQAEARKNNWPVAIAPVDTHGFLVAFEKMDNTQAASVQIAIDKAASAAMYRRPTKAFHDAAFIPHGFPRRGSARSFVRNIGFRPTESSAISVAPQVAAADHPTATHQTRNDASSSLLRRKTMSFERHHPNREVDRNLSRGRDLRSAYLFACLATITEFMGRAWRAPVGEVLCRPGWSYRCLQPASNPFDRNQSGDSVGHDHRAASRRWCCRGRVGEAAL